VDTYAVPGKPRQNITTIKEGTCNMTKKSYPTDVLQQARAVLDAWQQIAGPGEGALSFGDLTSSALSSEIQQSSYVEAEMTSLETKLTDLRNQRDTVNQAIWDKVKRVRAGMKAIYGDNSSQYEMVGGTRLSERKSPTRKVAAP
jgi:hypothetical protein